LIILLTYSCVDNTVPDVIISFPSTEVSISDTTYKIDECVVSINKNTNTDTTFFCKDINKNKIVLNDFDFNGRCFNFDNFKYHTNDSSYIEFYIVLKKGKSTIEYQVEKFIDSLRQPLTFSLRHIIE